MTTSQTEIIIAPIAGKTVSLAKAEYERIRDIFQPMWEDANTTVARYASIHVTDPNDKAGMKVAHAAWRALVDIRLAADKARKAEKEYYLKMGGAFQDMYNNIEAITKPEEKRLEDCAKFGERAEAARKKKIREDRTAALAVIGAPTTGYVLEDMSQERFDDLLAAETEKIESAKRAAALAELERQERLKAEAAERERLREENRVLQEQQAAERAEAKRRADEAREASEAQAKAAEAQRAADRAEAARVAKEAADKARAEQDRLNKLAKKEREAREAAEAEIAKRKAEDERIAAESEKIRIAAESAPDIAKIRSFADAVMAIPFPAVSTDAGSAVKVWLMKNTENFCKTIYAKAEGLKGTQ